MLLSMRLKKKSLVVYEYADAHLKEKYYQFYRNVRRLRCCIGLKLGMKASWKLQEQYVETFINQN